MADAFGPGLSAWCAYVGTGAVDGADVRLRSVAAPVLHEMQLRTGAVVHLGVLDRGEIVHLDKLGGPSARQVPTSVGVRIPAHRVALGVAALAGLSPEDVVAELNHVRGWEPDAAWWGELHKARRRVVIRQGDYTAPMLSVAATIGSRAAIGIVTSTGARAAMSAIGLRIGGADRPDAGRCKQLARPACGLSTIFTEISTRTPTVGAARAPRGRRPACQARRS